MSTSDENVIYEFEGFEFDVAQHRLVSADGKPIELPARVLDTLVCLLQNRGQLVDKDTLMRTVWPDTVVEENNLNQAITALRKSLGDTRRERRFIATDPGRGYRFVARVKTHRDEQAAEEANEPDSRFPAKKLNIIIVGVMAVVAVVVIVQAALHADWRTMFGPEASYQSIAVLPLADLSPDGDQEYFSDGVTEELLNELSKLQGLRVTGRTSSFYFKGKNEDLRVIGERLNVDNVLEGSVRKAEGRVRITVNLINASDGYHLWSQNFDGDLQDIFAIQEDTAKSVANALSITLGVGQGIVGAGGTRNFDAYDAYLAGNSLWRQADRESALQAVDQFEKAVLLDPEYANAWAALAVIYDFSASFFVPGHTEDLTKKSEMAAARAIEIAPDTISSLLLEAARHERNHEWVETERILREVQTRAPMNFVANFRLGVFNQNIGWPSASIAYYRRAAEIEPLLLLPIQNIVGALGNLGEFDAALAEYEASKSLIGDHALTHAVAATIALQTGDRQLAEDYLDELIANDPGPIDTREFTRTMRSLLDSPEQGRKEVRRYYDDPGYQLPLLHNAMSNWASYFGDEELALQILADLYENKRFLVSAIWRPIHRDMRQLPEFKILVRELGLVDYWRTTGNWGDFCRPIGDNDFECD